MKTGLAILCKVILGLLPPPPPNTLGGTSVRRTDKQWQTPLGETQLSPINGVLCSHSKRTSQNNIPNTHRVCGDKSVSLGVLIFMLFSDKNFME